MEPKKLEKLKKAELIQMVLDQQVALDKYQEELADNRNQIKDLERKLSIAEIEIFKNKSKEKVSIFGKLKRKKK